MSTRRAKTHDPETCRWETGELGRDADHVAVVDAKASLEDDDALDLQMISIRLEKGLLRDLKEIANYNGIGYQPMIRDLLHRFVQAELKSILHERLKELEQAEQEQSEATGPVGDFMGRRRA